ncbi:MAG: HD domain-containing protein [Lachnospiraceae bacterium]|nr:HD domain-containing protein [Lachnospiraceae bacterium]
MEKDRLQRQLDFIMELDKEKEIVRQTYLADGSRKETDAEHAWHMAIMCCLLSEYANEPIDVAKTVMMLLTHDLVEIDAGDTYAYDDAGNATKRERELRAADRIYGLLPEEQAAYMRGLWDEFEAMETPEAKFANALDKVQPVLLNDASGGKSWKEHGVHESWIRKRNARTPEGSERLWELASGLIEKNMENGYIQRDQEPGGESPSGR